MTTWQMHEHVKWAQPQQQFQSPLITMPIVTTVARAVCDTINFLAKLSEAVGSIRKLFCSAESLV
jgi:hypothetical protein